MGLINFMKNNKKAQCELCLYHWWNNVGKRISERASHRQRRWYSR